MSNKTPKFLQNLNRGLIQDVVIRLKLIYRLMMDRRISPFIKILPVGALAYWLIPDPVIGPLDDATILWLGSYLFVELCPPAVVQEHLQALRSAIPSDWQDPKPGTPPKEEEIIDGEFKDVPEK